MFNTGKTTHDSIEAAINDAQNSETKNDCAHLKFDTGRETFTVQFLDSEDDRSTVFNVTGMSDHDALKRALPFDVEDEGRSFLVLESGTAGEDTVRDELVVIVKELGGSLDDVVTTKAFTAGKPTVRGNLKSILGME